MANLTQYRGNRAVERTPATVSGGAQVDGAPQVLRIVSMTEAAYTALATKDANTLYLLT